MLKRILLGRTLHAASTPFRFTRLFSLHPTKTSIALRPFTLAAVVLVAAIAMGQDSPQPQQENTQGTGSAGVWVQMDLQFLGGSHSNAAQTTPSSVADDSIPTVDAPVPHRDMSPYIASAKDFQLPSWAFGPGPMSANFGRVAVVRLLTWANGISKALCPPPVYCGPVAGFDLPGGGGSGGWPRGIQGGIKDPYLDGSGLLEKMETTIQAVHGRIIPETQIIRMRGMMPLNASAGTDFGLIPNAEIRINHMMYRYQDAYFDYVSLTRKSWDGQLTATEVLRKDGAKAAMDAIGPKLNEWIWLNEKKP
jgi:hypothetical protein